MKRLISLATLVVAALGLLAGFSGAAAADTQGPIDFESYNVGNIDGQQGWMKTGSYDVTVENAGSFPLISTYGFGTQALRSSDAVTSGSFGDQTFSPGLTDPSTETSNPHFEASFSIGTALATAQNGLHMSVSPDNGQGGRMSYLRFEEHGDGLVHVFFDDTTASAPCTPAQCVSFNDTEIAHFALGTVHSFKFVIDQVPGTLASGGPNDVVKIYEDSALLKTGTTWENYYRYDPESSPFTVVPSISKLLFRESGTANASDSTGGFLVDNVALASSPLCTPTPLSRDGINLTAKLVNPASPVNGTVDATGCNIGVYYGDGNAGTVSGATITGANYYGVVADGAAVDISNSSIHDIGENPFNGTQHGVAVLYTTVHQDGGTTTHPATGTLSGSTISRYQKNGVVVSGTRAAVTIKNNTVTGAGPVNYIAQNGIEIASGASASITGNTVSGHFYTPATVTACGLLFFQAGGVKQSMNNLFANQTNLCNAGRGGGGFSG
jgi:hypothetical protein